MRLTQSLAMSGLAKARSLTASARKLNRPVLIYFKTSECGHFRKMDHTTWSDPSVSRAVSQNFDPVKVDGEQNSEWLDRLKVRGFPAEVVLSTSRDVLLHVEGYQSSKHLLRRLERLCVPRRARSAGRGFQSRIDENVRDFCTLRRENQSPLPTIAYDREGRVGGRFDLTGCESESSPTPPQRQPNANTIPGATGHR